MALGVINNQQVGGVEFRGPLETLWQVCLASRIAESVRLRLKPFVVRGFSSLEKELRKLPFRAFISKGRKVRVRAVCHHSRLWHSGAVQERVEEVLKKYVGLEIDSESKGEADSDVQLIHVRVQDDEVQVSLSASGERMHRRGYRVHVQEASLRETLAAALIASALKERKATPGSELLVWDPFCGAGTIVLEMVHGALGYVAGAKRRHAFESFRAHESDAYALFLKEFSETLRNKAPFSQVKFWASDRSQKALDATTNNLKEAGLTEFGEVLLGDIEEIEKSIPLNALIVTNPPYGKRLKDTEAIGKLMRVLKKRPDLTPAFVLLGGAGRDAVPQECPALFRTKNGGVSVSARKLA